MMLMPTSVVTETSVPGARRRRGPRSQLPAELVGTQTTSSAMSVTSDRQR